MKPKALIAAAVLVASTAQAHAATVYKCTSLNNDGGQREFTLIADENNAMLASQFLSVGGFSQSANQVYKIISTSVTFGDSVPDTIFFDGEKVEVSAGNHSLWYGACVAMHLNQVTHGK